MGDLTFNKQGTNRGLDDPLIIKRQFSLKRKRKFYLEGNQLHWLKLFCNRYNINVTCYLKNLNSSDPFAFIL